MLKITNELENAELIRVNLHGHFTAEYVSEVEKTLSSSGQNAGEVALDLRNVTFVDRAAMEYLRGTRLTKIKIENTPSYVTRWIEQEVS
ncbi:MAG: STAS domain-containing protein [Pyrinomonadaceae bacterium]|nr:STAS domain-containing protein [Pyrinomonadaceae bacterium]